MDVPSDSGVALTGGIAPGSFRRPVTRADLRAVAEVRAALRDLLRPWGRPARAEVALLLASELVTNALVHTGRGAVVTARLGGGPAERLAGRLRVEVRDFVSRHPTPLAHQDGAGTSGRGLLLVHALADAWGVRAHGVGKAVWFELAPDPA